MRKNTIIPRLEADTIVPAIVGIVLTAAMLTTITIALDDLNDMSYEPSVATRVATSDLEPMEEPREGGMLEPAVPMFDEIGEADCISADAASVTVDEAGIRHMQAIAITGDAHAHDNGAMSERFPGYFAAHDWSDPGQAILDLEAGDVFYLNDQAMRVAEVTRIPQASTMDVIFEMQKSHPVVMQTCYPDEYVRILLVDYAA